MAPCQAVQHPLAGDGARRDSQPLRPKPSVRTTEWLPAQIKEQKDRMDRALLDDVELEYELHGDGEPVLLIHPGIFADWFTPLLREPALISRYRLVHYHRVGCAGSSRVAGPVSLARQAAHSRFLMQHLGIARAHVVGHSSSGNIALQLALDAPEVVQSLAILEPALMSVPSATTSRAFVGAAVQLYRGGDKAGAVDTLLTGNLRARLPCRLGSGASGRIRPTRGRRGDVLRTGAARAAAVVVPAGGRQAHHSTGLGCCRGAESGAGSDLGRAAATVARLATQRRAVRASERDAPAAGRKSARHGRGLAAFFARHPLTVLCNCGRRTS